MLKSKRVLKLSRNGSTSQTAGNGDLDDSIEDFIVTRPSKTERKLQKIKDPDRNPTVRTEVLNQAGAKVEASCAKFLSADAQSKSPEKTSPYFELKTEPNAAVPATTSNAQQKNTTRKKNSRKGTSKKTDSSDLALALALSESMQMAGEIERQKQEELLLTENLVDVIADIRSEEANSENLAPIFLKSPPQPVTKMKRKGKADKKPKEYVLAVRTQTERERLIAERAAAVLSLANDMSKGERTSLFYTEPNSDFLKKYQQKVNTLWERTTLVSIEGDPNDMLENFYVTSLRSLLTLPKESGYTNIHFHVSQLPGRQCSQIDHGALTATQAILEQLAFAADGGFVEDSNAEDDQFARTAPIELVHDWSKMVNNSLMSDLLVITSDGPVHAHRLVLAVRFPQLLNHIEEDKLSKPETCELDWSDYSMYTVKKVLQFIYTAEYQHDETVAEEVCHLCRNYNIRALSERIPNHEQYSFLNDGDSEEDMLEREKDKHSDIANVTPEEDTKLLNTPKVDAIQEDDILVESSNDSQRTVKLDAIEEKDTPLDAYPKIAYTKNESDSEIEELASFLVKSPIKATLQGLSCNTSKALETPTEKSLEATPPIAEKQSTKFKISRESLSPDMFQDCYKSCREAEDLSLDTSDVIDLTQDSDKVLSACCSPLHSNTANLETKNEEQDFTTDIHNWEDSTTKAFANGKEESACEYGASSLNHKSYAGDSSFLPPTHNMSKSSRHSSFCSKNTSNSSAYELNKSSIFENSGITNSPTALRGDVPENYLDKSQKSPVAKSDKNKKSPEKTSELSPQSYSNSPPISAEDDEFKKVSMTKDKQIDFASISPEKKLDDSFSAWEHCNDGIDSAPFCPSPSSPIRTGSQFKGGSPSGNFQNVSKKGKSLASSQPARSVGRLDPTPPRASQKSKTSNVEDLHTPEIGRPSKKMKIDVTPLPNYHAMDTPGLKKELDKFGLKPMTRKNAVKLLNHIYEELHPFVTDSECSFEDTPERAAVAKASCAQKDVNSPSKSSLDRSSQEESESSLAEDEESMIVTEIDRQNSRNSPSKAQSAVPLNNHLKQFFQNRPELYKKVLTYEPIEFEFLYKEMRKDGIRCKAQELLNWLDEQCITCRMKKRDRARKPKNSSLEASHKTPDKVSEKPAKNSQGRRVAKKLIA